MKNLTVVDNAAVRRILSHCAREAQRSNGRQENRARQRQRAARDAAIIALAFGCGIRVFELVTLTAAGYSPSEGVLRVPGRSCPLPYPAGVGRALELWLGRGHDGRALLFYDIPLKRHRPQASFTGETLRYAVKERCRKAGVDPFSPENFRRSFAAKVESASVKAAIRRDLLGHASRSEKPRNDALADEAMRQFMLDIYVPMPGLGL